MTPTERDLCIAWTKGLAELSAVCRAGSARIRGFGRPAVHELEMWQPAGIVRSREKLLTYEAALAEGAGEPVFVPICFTCALVVHDATPNQIAVMNTFTVRSGQRTTFILDAYRDGRQYPDGKLLSGKVSFFEDGKHYVDLSGERVPGTPNNVEDRHDQLRSFLYSLELNKLTPKDLARLAKEGISEAMASEACLSRKSNREICTMLGLNGKKDYSGVVFPYFSPFEVRDKVRIRRDHPEMKATANGFRISAKYAQPRGAQNCFYFQWGETQARCKDTSLRVVICEGEKKSISVNGIFKGAALVLGIAGVDSWRGQAEPREGENGEAIRQTGVMADFDRIRWDGRRVQLACDANFDSNANVKRAYKALAKALIERGANVALLKIPTGIEGISGVDDLIGLWGPEKVLARFDEPVEAEEVKLHINERIKRELMCRHHFMRDELDRLYLYRDGTYVGMNAERTVRELAEKLCSEWNEPWFPSVGSAAVESMTLNAPDMWTLPPQDKVNLINGILTLPVVGDEVAPQTPEFLSPIRIPVKYDPKARCPKIEAFLSQVLPNDAQYLLPAIAGLLMTPNTSLQKVFLLKGDGGNGKGVFTAILSAFIGDSNYSAKTLQQFSDNRFTTSALVGKLANICTDLPATYIKETGTFKACVAGEDVDAEKKGQDSVRIKPFARFVFSTNAYPQTADNTKGFFRRWVVCEFNQTFAPRDNMQEGDQKARDFNQLVAELTTPEELSGLLNLALAQRARFGEGDAGFPLCLSLKTAYSNFVGTTDHLAAWMQDHVSTKNKSAEYRARDFRQQFRDWAKENDFPVLSDNMISRRLKEIHTHVKVIDRNDVSYFVGVAPVVEIDEPRF